MSPRGRGFERSRLRRVDHPPELEALESGRLHRFAWSIARMADGAEVSLPVIVLAGRAARPRLVAVAGVHGDEHEGPAALLEAARRIDPATLAGRVVIVPVANPPAFRANARRNPIDGVDLNRVFPGDPSGSISSRIAHQLMTGVVPGSDLLISIHGWTTGSLTVPYCEYPRHSSVAGVSRAAAFAMGLPYCEGLDWLPGRLMTNAAEAGTPAIEAEVGGEGITLPERRAVALAGVMRLLDHLGILRDPQDGAGSGVAPVDVRRTTLAAPVGGALLRHVELGEVVRAGSRVATISDLSGVRLASVYAAEGGVVAMLRHAGSVEPGDAVAAVFTPLA